MPVKSIGQFGTRISAVIDKLSAGQVYDIRVSFKLMVDYIKRNLNTGLIF
jgi:hypothetical protein